MKNEQNKQGYVYILSAKNMDLPISKIGMTQRTPKIRCSEINKSSTGDLLWDVFTSVFVNDCFKTENLLHLELANLRQKGREFFNLYPKDANDKLITLLENSNSISKLEAKNIIPPYQYKSRVNLSNRSACSAQHEQLEKIGVYDLFEKRLNCIGRKFGQSGSGIVGISDNNDGVQWNLAIYEDTGDIKLGVNLEGMKYQNFPIAHFINQELHTPSIEILKQSEFNSDLVIVNFYRDAWQMASRPNILEKELKHSGLYLSELNDTLWKEMLDEAKTCFLEKKNGYGRNKQNVTVVKKDGQTKLTEMEVSPHLNIQTIVGNVNDNPMDIKFNLEEAFIRLNEVYSWVGNRINSPKP